MNENEPQLPDDLRKALKESPTFTPPESFYRGILEKIDRKREAVPWYFWLPDERLGDRLRSGHDCDGGSRKESRFNPASSPAVSGRDP